MIRIVLCPQAVGVVVMDSRIAPDCPYCGRPLAEHEEYAPSLFAKLGAGGERTMRTILVHLNVEVPEGDSRTADQVADAVLGALEVGLVGDPGRQVEAGLAVSCPLAEEV